MDVIDSVAEALERIANPRELALLVLAIAMVGYGGVADVGDGTSVALIAIGSGMFFVAIFLPGMTEFQIGPSGFSAKLRERDEEVRATLEPHTDDLMRTAALLTGDRDAGQRLLEQALVETYMRWREAKQEGAVEAVRRHLGDLAEPAAQVMPPVPPVEVR